MNSNLTVIKYNLIRLPASGDGSIIFDNNSFMITSSSLKFSGTLPELINKYGIQNVKMTYYVQATGEFSGGQPSIVYSLYATTKSPEIYSNAHMYFLTSANGGTTTPIKTDWINVSNSSEMLNNINFSSSCNYACPILTSGGWANTNISVKVNIDVITASISHFSNLDKAYNEYLLSPVPIDVNNIQGAPVLTEANVPILPEANVPILPEINANNKISVMEKNELKHKLNNFLIKKNKEKCWAKYRTAIIWLIIIIILVIIIVASLSKHHKKCAQWISKNVRK